MKILETERLFVREIIEDDAPFINALLNSESFIKFIGDRGVRSDDDARLFIRDRYRQSYVDHGYGLYTVVQKADNSPIGVCGFVRRDTLPGPDIGFAFLPEYEGKGFGTESASAMMEFGRDTLRFEKVFAITSLNNWASEKLLKKLGFDFEGVREVSDDESLKVFRFSCDTA
jgi:RimJ/RimL family protein N-acetyltransferase